MRPRVPPHVIGLPRLPASGSADVKNSTWFQYRWILFMTDSRQRQSDRSARQQGVFSKSMVLRSKYLCIYNK